MAEPVRNDEPLSSVQFPESPARPGPVPVRDIGEDPAALLPERATEQPLGEWPRDRHREEGPSTLENMRQKVKPIADFVQDRAADLRHRFRVVCRRFESGELQEEMRDRASDLADDASEQARYARRRAELYARGNPLRLIAGAAIAGFLIGFLLRIGRDE